VEKCESWKPLGLALLDYWKGNKNATLLIRSSMESDRRMPVRTFFREDGKLPPLEQKALRLCRGKILDAGAGAGPHSLRLQEQGLEVHSLDISPDAVQVMLARGLKHAFAYNFFDLPEGEKYDTLLMMMNGIGIAGDLDGLERFLEKAKALLNEGGQVIFDSTNVDYVTPSTILQARLPGYPHGYYGICKYQLVFDNCEGEIYPWLYIDQDTLRRYAEKAGFQLEILGEDEEHYLGKLVVS
jgi:SAM-dependent methyltransferase